MITNLTDSSHARMVARRSAALVRVDDGIAAAARDAVALAGKWGAGGMALEEWDAASAALKARQTRLRDDRAALVAAGAGGLDGPADVAALNAKWAAGNVDQRRRMLLSAMPFGIGVEPADAAVAPTDRLFVISGRP